MKLYPCAFTLVVFLHAFSALAGPADNCSNVLIPSTTNVTYNAVTDTALAYSLNEASWKEAYQKYGANADIYGVTIGGSYADYHKNVEKKAQNLKITNFTQYAYAYATSGLTPDVLAAYTRCMTSQYGVGVYAGPTGENHYTILISYQPPVDVGEKLSVAAASTNIEKASAQKLESYVANSSAENGRPFFFQLSLTPEHPSQESTVDIKVGNQSGSLVLPALATLKSVPAAIESIKDKLVGLYQVMLGPNGGCGGGKPHSKPANYAKIATDGRDLTAFNECSQPTSVRISIDGKKIYWYGESATVSINGDQVVLVDDIQNTWEKVQR